MEDRTESVVKDLGFEVRQVCIQVMASSLFNLHILHAFLNLFEPQFPHL